MANEEQLAILKQGVDVWNKWKKENPGAKMDLSRANLSAAQLNGANLSGVDLSGAKLFLAQLNGAQLSGADLSRANLKRANLSKANLKQAEIGVTMLSDLDLRSTLGLEEVKHVAPSTIGTDAFKRSHGQIPDVFLIGCGLSNWEIEETKLYDPDLSNEKINETLYKIYDLRAGQALQISPLFISYSHADSAFVDKVGNCLIEKGVRYWRDIHKATAGPLEEQVNRAIRQNPTVLVILSEHSIKSDWVEHEVRTARETAKELGRHVLCPVALDDSWKTSPWPQRIMEQIMEYNILDFSAWKDDAQFGGMFRRLIDGLDLFYK